MPKRYYNLEKETKGYLKTCDDLGITPTSFLRELNNFCLKQKNVNWSMTSKQLIEYSFLPNIWLDSTIPYSYPRISQSWINMINPSFNAAFSAVQYDNSYGGSLSVSASGSNVPWFSNGITSSFTINVWATFLSGAGTYNTGFLMNENYLTRGFRSGLVPSSRRYIFWNSESVPSGTPNTFSVVTPVNSITYGVPINITLMFDVITGVASIYLNGVLSVASPTNRTYIPPITGSNLGLNGTLVGTSQTALWHSLKVYNRVLSLAEITSTYNLLKGRFGL